MEEDKTASPYSGPAHSSIAGEPGKVRPMPFTVYGEHPGGGHSEFTRDTATGAASRPPISWAMDGRAFILAMKGAKSSGLIGSIS